MTSRSKEKVAAAFRKLFRSPEKLDNDGAGPSGSPARRGLLRRHRYLLLYLFDKTYRSMKLANTFTVDIIENDRNFESREFHKQTKFNVQMSQRQRWQRT